jgi:hypothetical protein
MKTAVAIPDEVLEKVEGLTSRAVERVLMGSGTSGDRPTATGEGTRLQVDHDADGTFGLS